MLNLTLLGRLVIYNYNNYNSSDFCRLFLCGFRKKLELRQNLSIIFYLGDAITLPSGDIVSLDTLSWMESGLSIYDMNSPVRDQIAFSFLIRLCANRASKRIFMIYCKPDCEDMFKVKLTRVIELSG